MKRLRVIDIVPYAERWPGEFQTIGDRLRHSLGDLALRIDHIGSTSVPGLPAKDVIDVQVTVAALDPVEPLVAAIVPLGYQFREEIGGDHTPPGIDPAMPWSGKRYFSNTKVHVHVRAEGSYNQRYPLIFRDYLRAHPAAAAAYAEVKRQLSKHGPADWDLYYDVKDPVCDIIKVAAEEWAATTGWTLGPSDA